MPDRQRHPSPRPVLALMLLAGLTLALAGLAAPPPARAQQPPRPTIEQLKQAILGVDDLQPGFSMGADRPWSTDTVSYQRTFLRFSGGLSDIQMLSAILVDGAAYAPATLAEAYIRDDIGQPDTVVERLAPPDVGKDAIQFTVRDHSIAGRTGMLVSTDVIAWRYEGVTIRLALSRLSSRSADVSGYAVRQQAKLAAVFPPAAPAAGAAATEMLPLAAGCTAVASTWPDGTALATIATAVTPPAALAAIWVKDPATGAYRGWAPGSVRESDLAVAGRADALIICARAAATISRPRPAP